MTLPAPNVDASKLEWRKWAKARRRTLYNASSAVQTQLHSFLLERNVEYVLSYRAFGSEINLELLPNLLPQLEFYVPRANLLPAPHLTVHPWNAPTLRSKLGMVEPASEALEEGMGLLECVLVPGLAFDAQGFRLGYGMGFYDCLLESLPNSVLQVGVCSSEMQVERLPRENHDQAVSWLADEHGVHRLH